MFLYTPLITIPAEFLYKGSLRAVNADKFMWQVTVQRDINIK